MELMRLSGEKAGMGKTFTSSAPESQKRRQATPPSERLFRTGFGRIRKGAERRTAEEPPKGSASERAA